MQEQKRILLDVDTGIDDALAIFYLLHSPNAVVEGITTGYGNVSVLQATYNTLQIVELAARHREIPVVPGAERPLLRNWEGPAARVHGENGFGDVVLPPPKRTALAAHAADFIVEKVNAAPGEMTLVCIGRLTNLALALAKDARLPQKVKEVVIMGGAVRVPGTVTPVSEANMHGDPEAAHLVFESGCPITLVPLDVARLLDVPRKVVFDEEHFAQLATTTQQAIPCLAQLLRFRLKAYDDGHVTAGPLHDPLAVAVALDPTLVQKEEMYVKIETKGWLSLGATIVDLRLKQCERHNASVCVDVDRERFLAEFYGRLFDGSKSGGGCDVPKGYNPSSKKNGNLRMDDKLPVKEEQR
ncbi:nucleoside hydrolase [Numidum massiliense]|uniref:nucleoside hydrolase n=1 Tax=Numidum massiliense TaxID=1522315 RepID=UPI0006D561B8|nr:nucleoside hydrolase [Numidum massiliense]